MRKRYNKDLRFIKEDWDGNPLDEQNLYQNLDGKSERGFLEMLKWQLGKNKYAAQKKGQESNVRVIKDKAFLSSHENFFTWLGHATFIFQYNGKKIITDPVFYDIWPLQRFTPMPCVPEELVGIDIILLSHNHRDHADQKSMQLLTQNNPDAIILTGLETGGLIRSWGIKNQVVEAGWYQEYPTLEEQITITYLPAKHWNRRFLLDLNEMLWGSFMLQFGDMTLYFGADSGRGIHFAEIGKLFDIDLAFLGIGAYEPVWFMHPSHTSPSDVIKVKEELMARYLTPMHYGTFDLSDEPIFNPKNELQRLSVDRNDVLIPEIGEVRLLSFLLQEPSQNFTNV